jgi:hypothetical protein
MTGEDIVRQAWPGVESRVREAGEVAEAISRLRDPGKSDRRARSVGAGKREKAAEEAPTTCRRLFRELFAARR